MNLLELQEAKNRFRVEEIKKERQDLYSARRRFVKRFSINKIESMGLDDYIEGKGNKESFCYGIERDLDGLGRIKGSPSIKFGIYYSKDEGKYQFAHKFGKTAKSAFNAIRQELIVLLKAGELDDIDAISQNKLSLMFKGKILATYYPERFLNIFDNEHLTHYLRVLNLDTESLVKQDAVYKREELTRFKNSDPDMKEWDLDLFGKFLYQNWPPASKLHPIKEEEGFPTTDSYSVINLTIVPGSNQNSSMTRRPAPKINYEEEARKYRRYGDRGEKIVLQYEINRLMDELNITEKQARKSVLQVSKQSDSFGYDIRSINEDGSPRYIEVKATTARKGDVEFYYTENEYEKALEYKESYFIYIVFEIKSINPKIWVVGNPFLSHSLEMKPVQYKVSIHTKGR